MQKLIGHAGYIIMDLLYAVRHLVKGNFDGVNVCLQFALAHLTNLSKNPSG